MNLEMNLHANNDPEVGDPIYASSHDGICVIEGHDRFGHNVALFMATTCARQIMECLSEWLEGECDDSKTL